MINSDRGVIILQQCWNKFEEIPCPGAKSPRKMVKGAKLHLESNSIFRCSEGSNKPCVHQDPEIPQRLRHTRIWVSLVEVVELFQILKDDAVKVLHSICQQIWKTQQWPQDWKRSAFIPIPKNAQTTAQLHSSHASKVMLSKFSKAGFSNTWTVNFLMFKLVLEKA